MWHLQRDVKRICGFTRETLIAVTTNIESRGARTISMLVYLRNTHMQILRVLLQYNIGKNFTLKEVKFNFRKVCLEFWNRIDPNLPYFLPSPLLRGDPS